MHSDTGLPPGAGAAVVEVTDVVLAGVVDVLLTDVLDTDVLDTDVLDTDVLAVDVVDAVVIDATDGSSFAVWSALQAAIASRPTDTVTTPRHDIAPITPLPSDPTGSAT